MPELPEVETTRLGLISIVGESVQAVHLMRPTLRWPIPQKLPQQLVGQTILGLDRRGKYLLFHFRHGVQLVHLGMSGSLRLSSTDLPLRRHDHVEWHLGNGSVLRYHDPRRFGAVLWTEGDPSQHPLLRELGPEPLLPDFTGDYWRHAIQGSKAPIHSMLLNAKKVAGVGNIYAQEALFYANVHPRRPAGDLDTNMCESLVAAIKTILARAIEAGGTTLRDFAKPQGEPGYFAQTLQVYGRDKAPCLTCGKILTSIKISNRTVCYCENCQI